MRSIAVTLLIVALAACSSSDKAASPSGADELKRPFHTYEQEDLTAARAKYRQVVEKDPSDKFGWYNLGVIAQSTKDPKTAAADFEKVLALDPKFEAALYQLGVIRLHAGDRNGAIDLLTRAVALKPNDTNAVKVLREAGRKTAN